jgi:hypothetical protein
MKNIFIRLSLTLIVIFNQQLAWSGMRDLETAQVAVYKEISSGKVIYTYAVTNKGNRPIIGLTIGHDFYKGNTELRGPYPNQILSPNKWAGRVVSLEESDRFEISWDIEDSSAAIPPGKTLNSFRIITSEDSPLFTSSNWTVIVDGPPVNASSQLIVGTGPSPNLDTTPPQLTVSLAPSVLWPPNKRMHTVKASILVKDNVDPNPQIKLLSIICNECLTPTEDIDDAEIGADDRSFSLRSDRIGKRKEGRTYTVKYSATDASGNTSTAEGIVSVPHDHRK